MKKEIGCPITIGEFNRLTANLKVYNQISDEQKEWLESFMDRNKYELKNVVLHLVDNILWVIMNTGKTVKEFSKE